MSVHDRDERISTEIMQCALCKHLDRTQDALVCPAYSGGIPKSILVNDWKHDTLLRD
jgi:hypothetical protein